MQVLTEWKSEIIGLVLGLPSLWFAFITYRHQRRTSPFKSFSLGARSKIFFVLPEEHREFFDVRFQGHEVERITDNRVYFMNTGNTQIDGADFILPGAVKYPGTKHFYNVEIIARKPRDLPAELDVDNDTITLKPLHLNAGDYVAVSFLRAGEPTKIEYSGRIKGVSRLSQLHPGNYLSWFYYYPIGLLMTGVSMAGFIAYMHTRALTDARPFDTWSLGFYVFPLGLIFGALSHWRRHRGIRNARFMGRGTEHLEFEPLVRE